MMFLPMVQRELRVLSRRRSTYRLRWIVGGVAFATVSLLLLIIGSVGMLQNGSKLLFYVGAGYSACVCLLGGLFATVDIISGERRDGTLGLLFLTDLKGYDVVIGKFSAVALNTFYWLLAILPVLSLPILLGGVTFGEFARMCLALVNLLFFTMCIGTWTSSRLANSMHSLSLSVSILLLLGIVLPLLFPLAAWLGMGAQASAFTFSPTLPLYSALAQNYPTQALRYWLPLISSHLLGWLCLVSASWTATTVWRKISVQNIRAFRHLSGNWIEKGFTKRQKYLDDNPALWLMRPGRYLLVTTWAITIFGSLAGIFSGISPTGSAFGLIPFPGGMMWMVIMPLKLLLVYQACRFVTQTRQSGAFELLLTTPLKPRAYLSAQKRMINRVFGLQFLILGIVLVGTGIPSLLVYHSSKGMTGVTVFFVQIYQLAMLIIDYHLLFWLAFSSSLQSKKIGWAFIRTVLLGMMLPSLFCWLDFFIKPIMLAAIAGGVEEGLMRLVRQIHDPDYSAQQKGGSHSPYSTNTLGGSA